MSFPTGLSARAVTMALSIPKQRLRPRATLYSPPPSHTRNCRAVEIRKSPGSRRSMTSPRLTKYQVQRCLGKSWIDVLPQLSVCVPSNDVRTAHLITIAQLRIPTARRIVGILGMPDLPMEYEQIL